jgi:hypothetical protein
VPSRPSDPQIDIAVRSRDEQERRLTAPPPHDAAEIDNAADTVRIERAPRAQTTEREMLQQPWLAE